MKSSELGGRMAGNMWRDGTLTLAVCYSSEREVHSSYQYIVVFGCHVGHEDPAVPGGKVLVNHTRGASIPLLPHNVVLRSA